MKPQQETMYRQQYGKMMDIGDSLRKMIIQHKSAALPSLTLPEDVAAKLIEAQQAVYQAQRLMEAAGVVIAVPARRA